jgi:hypothetical protein
MFFLAEILKNAMPVGNNHKSSKYINLMEIKGRETERQMERSEETEKENVRKNGEARRNRENGQ